VIQIYDFHNLIDEIDNFFATDRVRSLVCKVGKKKRQKLKEKLTDASKRLTSPLNRVKLIAISLTHNLDLSKDSLLFEMVI
jgi:hypothetical protein